MKLRLIYILAALLFFGASASAQETVRIAQSLTHNTLNPAEATGLADASVMRVMYEGLLGFNENSELVPELATSWDVNDDATVLDFTLREGVTFHDGTPFDAEAAKAYYDWVLDPDSSGARGRSLLSDISSIEVTGPHALRITLKQPNGAFLFNLATSGARIASPASIEEYGDQIGRHPVGTGPFQFVSWEDGQSITVEAYEGYWGGAPNVDQIEFLEVNNAATRVAMLQSGEVQFSEDLPPQLIEAVDADPNLEVVASQSTTARILQLNTQHPPFDDVRVRQALNYAVDKDQLVNVVFRGYASPLRSPMPDPVFGFAAQEPYTYDPERAKELLAEAGYPDGFEMKVLTFTGDEYRTAGQVLQQMFAQIGVTLTLDQQERGALVDQIFKPLEENPTEAALVGASTPTGDADRWLTVSFSRNSWPPASNNWSFYDNPEIDSILQEARATSDQDKRAELYAQAQQIIWEDAPWVFLYSANNIAGMSTNLSGVFYLPEKSVDARRADLN